MTLTYGDVWLWSRLLREDDAARMDHDHRFVMLDPVTAQILALRRPVNPQRATRS